MHRVLTKPSSSLVRISASRPLSVDVEKEGNYPEKEITLATFRSQSMRKRKWVNTPDTTLFPGSISSRYSRSSASYRILTRNCLASGLPHVDGCRLRFFRNWFPASTRLHRFENDFFTRFESMAHACSPPCRSATVGLAKNFHHKILVIKISVRSIFLRRDLTRSFRDISLVSFLHSWGL